jgi:hypothetical protein
MSLSDVRHVAMRCLGHVRAAQGGLRFEVLRSERSGLRARLLDALSALSESEAMVLGTVRSGRLHRRGMLAIRKGCRRALDAVEHHDMDLVETPGISANLEAVIELLPAGQTVETKDGAA